MTNKTIKNNILKLRDQKAIIDTKLYNELDTIDQQLDNGQINDDQYDTLENEIYIKYDNVNSINSQLLKLENEYINIVITELKSIGQYSNELKELFKQAGSNATIHNKLIDKILKIN